MKPPVVIDVEPTELPPASAQGANADVPSPERQDRAARLLGDLKTAASETDCTELPVPAHPEDCEGCEVCGIPLDGRDLPPTVEHLVSAENAVTYLDQEFPRWRDYWPPACVYVGRTPMFHRAELQAWIEERRASEAPPEENGITV